MKNPLYRKNVTATLSVKPAKAGLRQMLRKQKTLNLGHALVGLGGEIGEVVLALTPFVTGASQLTTDLKAKARSEFGDVLYFTFVAGKMLKAKLPASTKKVKLKGMTISEAILKLNEYGTLFVGQYKKVYYGLELDEAKIAELYGEFVELLWAVVYTVYGEAPAPIMEENVAKLAAKYPGQVFSTEAAQAGEEAKKAEEQAVTVDGGGAAE
ncbi:hypothetical protein DLP05_066 [Stenotrophomonas phage vB_SmaS_DLP_5]|uniref:Uncharacterized protein n=1 Tax=Stenotrophomonas phage vB_SmaS_DLP_5 TaxID=2044561 RepID=A0A2D2W2F2_9CAUD|nr:hypothetical protein FDJ07_gp065 [Stenotrophomonas phage vB_SmaS_DLP_5]ATS92321.1 hypothetical protein DLP05_066 [Stenotrophomonas phage vB_SmaS_DLP_5]